VIDTKHFKGNYPDRFFLQGMLCRECSDGQVLEQTRTWPILLGEQKLGPDAVHEFALEVAEPVSHIRLNIIPDGGISRLRLLGQIA
jgi:allantoicase